MNKILLALFVAAFTQAVLSQRCNPARCPGTYCCTADELCAITLDPSVCVRKDPNYHRDPPCIEDKCPEPRWCCEGRCCTWDEYQNYWFRLSMILLGAIGSFLLCGVLYSVYMRIKKSRRRKAALSVSG